MQNKNKINIFLQLLLCYLIVISIFFNSLDREWITSYDENVITDDLIVPTPHSISEAVEIVSTFGIKSNLTSNNLLYTSNSVNRTSLLAVPFLLTLGLLFKKSAFFYHLFNLFLHLINTTIIFFILKKFENQSNKLSKILTILLTILWAIHPVQVESILLSTNVGATLSYITFFLLFNDFINHRNNLTLKRKIILPFCFLLPMLLNEYIIIIPALFIAYSFIENFKENNFITTIKKTLHECFPYLVGLFFYIIYFAFSNYSFIKSSNSNSINLLFERIFWLSPQILIHYLKLIFYPNILSIDQSAQVKFGESLFSIYSSLCVFTIFIIVLIPLFIFLFSKKLKNLALISTLFFISLLPFSQILSPTYCLCAERYLYTPLFFLVLGLIVLFNTFTNKKIYTIGIIFLLIANSCLGLRTLSRINDWKDNVTLLESTIKTSPNYLYTGFRIYALAKDFLDSNADFSKVKKLADKSQLFYFNAIEEYENKKEVIKYPKIISFYGLDNDSLISKAVYLASLRAISFPNEDPKIYLALFNEHIKSMENLNVEILEFYANLLFAINDVENAKKVFYFAYDKYPESQQILISLIRLEREKFKNLEKSKLYLNKALELFPYSKFALFEAVKQYEAENNLFLHAKYSYLHGLRTNSIISYQNALSDYLNLSDKEQSKKTLDKLFILEKNNPVTLYLAGIYYMKTLDFSKAKNYLQTSLSLITGKSEFTELEKNILLALRKVYMSEMGH